MMPMQRKSGMPYLVVLLTILLLTLGGIGYWSVSQVANLTTELYEHPYTVSTAVLRINSNISNMNLTMKNMLLATTTEEIVMNKEIIDENEKKVLADFQVVGEQFLGEPRLVQEALQAFLIWKSVREEVISLIIADKRPQAVTILRNTENQQFKAMESAMQSLLDFAQNKAWTFQSDAQKTRTKIIGILWVSFLVAMFLATIIFRRTVKLEADLNNDNEQLEGKVAERTSEIAAANEEMNALNEEIRAMNEELMTMNEKLETRVEERNYELLTSYQEVKATEEELRAQFENLQETQQELYHEKLLTNALFDSVPGMLYLYNEQGKLVRWNKKHEEMTGYSSEELSGMDLLDWYKGDEETTLSIQNALQRGFREGFADVEADLQRKDGTKIVAYLTAVPLKIEDKNYFAGIGIDIAERKKAKEEMAIALEKAEKANIAKSQFLANMSHEIRTPMNGIIGMTDLTLMTDLKEEQREYLMIVRSSTISLLRVLNDILDYSKVEAGKIDLEQWPFDLYKTVHEVTDLFEIGAKQKGLNLTLMVNPRVPNRVIGDSIRLRQVLSNIVGNGIKFTYQGEVVINVDVIDQYENRVKLKFMVTDTGIGIPEDKLDMLFKRFSQVDDSNTRQFGGTGLGLAISKKLIEIMGGEIGVESTENIGSRFFFTAIFTLPEENEKNREENAMTNERILYNNKIHKKILLAEDDVVSRNMVTIMLEQRGFEVTAVENGEEAISAFEKDKFDVILMDVNMPYTNGYSATITIREKEKNINYRTPIIAMTAYALKGDREKCLEVGMDDYISKPISLKQAMDTIQRYANIETKEKNTTNHNDDFNKIVFALMAASDLDQKTSEIIVTDFCNQSMTLIMNIKENIAAKKIKEAQIILHQLKGSAGNVRAEKIAIQAIEAEKAMRNMDIENVASLVQGMEKIIMSLMKTSTEG